MRILKTSQVKMLEDLAIERGYSSSWQMKSAGAAAATFINKKIDLKGKTCVVLCGLGINGGYGYQLAIKLYNSYVETKVISVTGQLQTPDVVESAQKAKKLGLKVIKTDDINEVQELIGKADVLIDAIFGIEYNGEMNRELSALNMLWNNNKGVKFALNLPTGIEPDTGIVDKYCFKSDYTISFNSLKLAHVMSNSKQYCGNVVVAGLGLPEEVISAVEESCFLIDEEMVFKSVQPRKIDTNKGDYGKLLNISGSSNMVGAAALSTLGALRSGAGIVTLASVKSVISNISGNLYEPKFLMLESQSGFISSNAVPQILSELKSSAGCLIGCGLGVNNETLKMVQMVVKQAECPLVIDADGINIIAKDVDILKEKSSEIILTPHVGEMARLLKMPVDEVIKLSDEVISNFAKEYNVTVVLKNSYTLVVEKTGKTYVNIGGNPGLAKGGSGDILAGIISGLMVQGVENAAVCGVYLHSKAAEKCAKRKSQYGMLPSDILDDLCEIFVQKGR